MKIISKIKDYYDWYSSIMGIDDKVVYDRRKCRPINTADYTCPDYFRTTLVLGDIVQRTIPFYNSEKIGLRKKIKEERSQTQSIKELHKISREYSKIKEGKILHFILEIGDTHYYFEVERYRDEKDENICHLDATLFKKIEYIKERYGGDTPISIIPVYNSYLHLMHEDIWKPSQRSLDSIIHNPILCNTYIPSFIPAEEVWRKCYEFISSLKDKPFVDTRTNDQHIESAGFDTKNSFRPKIKD